MLTALPSIVSVIYDYIQFIYYILFRSKFYSLKQKPE